MEKGMEAAFKRFVGAHFDGTSKDNFSAVDVRGCTQLTFGGVHSQESLATMKQQLASHGIAEDAISTSDGIFSVTLPNVPASVEQLNGAAGDAARRDVTARTRKFVAQMKARLTAANGGNNVAADQEMQQILEAHTHGNTLASGEGFRGRYGAGAAGVQVKHR